jgi:fructan beta-fructosidase
LGWMSNWQYANDVPTAPWRSAMSLPRELVVRKTPEGLRLAQKPVRELQKLRGKSYRLNNVSVAQANQWLKQNQIAGDLWEIQAEFAVNGMAEEFGFNLLPNSNQVTTLRCDTRRKVLTLDRTRSGRKDFHGAFSGAYEAPISLHEATFRLHLFIDTSSIEVFANNGESVMTTLVWPASQSGPAEIWSSNSELTVRRLNVWKLKPAVPIESN